ncbi:MAG TPA: hypothetical protein V6D22_20195 [Candidatus Obscuribacterales bacterium]
MLRRATALGIISSVILTIAFPMVGTQNSRAQAADVGGYVVGAGLGLLLGSLLYRNSGTNYSPQYSYSGSTAQSQPQPHVVYGWYNDGYAATYGPIVVPPPGYVQPSTSVSGSILNSTTYGTVIGANGAPVTGVLVTSPTGSSGTIIDPATGMPLSGPLVGTPVTVTNSATGTTAANTGLPTTTNPTPTTTGAATTTTSPTTATAPKLTGPAMGRLATGSSIASATAHATAGMAQHLSAGNLVHSLGTHFGSLGRVATSSVRSSAMHSAMQHVSRGSISMIKTQAGRSLRRVF